MKGPEFFFLSFGKYGKGPFCHEEADLSGMLFDKPDCIMQPGGILSGRGLYLRLRGSEGSVGGQKVDDAGGKLRSCPAACPFRGGYWPEGGYLI